MIMINMQPPGAGDRELGCIRGDPALLAFLFSLLPFPFFLTVVFFLAFFLLLPSSSFTSFTSSISFTSFTFGRVRINRSNRCSICCVPDDHSFLTKINYLTKNMQNANSYSNPHAGPQRERVPEEGEIGVFPMTIHF